MLGRVVKGVFPFQFQMPISVGHFSAFMELLVNGNTRSKGICVFSNKLLEGLEDITILQKSQSREALQSWLCICLWYPKLGDFALCPSENWWHQLWLFRDIRHNSAKRWSFLLLQRCIPRFLSSKHSKLLLCWYTPCSKNTEAPCNMGVSQKIYLWKNAKRGYSDSKTFTYL